LVDASGRDLRRAPIEAQYPKAASFFSGKRLVCGLSHQVAHGLAERETMALRVRFGYLHGIVFKLQRRSGHVSIIPLK
jgi:hypothetical protein